MAESSRAAFEEHRPLIFACVVLACVMVWSSALGRMVRGRWLRTPGFVRRLVLAAMNECGRGVPMPRHVAFVMDGNRRWAKRANLEPHAGHAQGFEKLTEVLRWCMEAGIETVTVYAFSIENFKRPKTEVDTIMDLAESKFLDMAEHGFVVEGVHFCIQVFGDKDLLRPSLRQAIHRAVDATASVKGRTLNVCLAYTGREEIAHATSSVSQKIRDGSISAADVTEKSIESHLRCDQVPLDLLVRTSGERRLSDFMLWQVSKGAFISFPSAVWPDFSFFDFSRSLLDYQLRQTF